MTLEAGQADLVPALALAVGDDADVDVLVLENRPLLDVQLEEGVDWPPADRLLAHEADALEFVAERLALAVQPGVGEFLVIDAGENARGDHRRRVA